MDENDQKLQIYALGLFGGMRRAIAPMHKDLLQDTLEQFQRSEKNWDGPLALEFVITTLEDYCFEIIKGTAAAVEIGSLGDNTFNRIVTTADKSARSTAEQQQRYLLRNENSQSYADDDPRIHFGTRTILNIRSQFPDIKMRHTVLRQVCANRILKQKVGDIFLDLLIRGSNRSATLHIKGIRERTFGTVFEAQSNGTCLDIYPAWE